MVEDLIQHARRRLILNQALGQAAFAAAILAGGLALLLILGTGYLSWWTLALFAAVGIGIGAWRLSRQTPDSYSTAVRLDETAHLHDALSTAFHFSHDVSASPKTAEFLRMQREQAESAARTVVLPAAVPFTIPRAFYAMAGLCILATGLVGIRYRVGHGLDLSRPLTEVLFEDQNAARPKQAARASKPGSNEWSEDAQNLLAKLGIKPEFDESVKGEPDQLDKAIEQALKQSAQQAKDQKGGDNSKGAEQGKDGTGSDDSPNGDPVDGGDKKAGDPKDGSAKSASKEGEPGSKSGQGKDGDSKDNLLAKLKDAVNSMLSKSSAKPAGSDPGKAQDKQGGPSEKKDGKKADPGQGQAEKGSGDSDSDDSDPNGDALGGQKGQGKDSTASSTQQKQEGSGIGLADGDKEVRAAEQLKAMGKISEIIGKRSATVSGETMVEVQSGKQQLHTSYTNAQATHVETDGDVTRDEIPLALQPYIQQYFAEVHKSDSAEGKGDAKKKSGK